MNEQLPMMKGTISFNAPEFEINNKEAIEKAIKMEADHVLAQLANVDTMKEAKDIRKNANKKISVTDEGRVKISQAFRKPANDLKKQVDVMLQPLADAIDQVNVVINDFKEREQQEKKQVIIRDFITPIYSKRGLDPSMASINPKWLNKSTSWNDINKEAAANANLAKIQVKHRNARYVTSDGKVSSYDGELIGHARKFEIQVWDDSPAAIQRIKDLVKSEYVINVKEL